MIRLPLYDSCLECPNVRDGIPSDPNRKNCYHCALYDVEWWNHEPESNLMVCMVEELEAPLRELAL